MFPLLSPKKAAVQPISVISSAVLFPGHAIRTSLGAVTLNDWYLLGISSDGISARLYLNGVFINSDDRPTTACTSDTVAIGGVMNSSNPVNGYIDEIYFSKTAIGDNGMAELWNDGDGITY